RPLKILHQLLEKPEISFVGLSNWSLDAAKMNRCITHNCPILSKDDLEMTSREIAKQRIHEQHILQKMNTQLNNLSYIYHEFKNYANKSIREDFFGARDYYSLVRQFIKFNNNKKFKKSQILECFFRNFGGVPNELLKIKLIPIIKDKFFLFNNNKFEKIIDN